MKALKTGLLALALIAFSTSASYGQWVEVGDAPDGVPARQDTVGVGPLTSISGVFDGTAGDHVDTYSIVITDVQAFFASTSPHLGGSAIDTSSGSNDDTRLFLWDEQGNILLGNDDDSVDALQSTLSDPSTYGVFNPGGSVDPTAAGISLNAGQKYLISVTYFANLPEDAGNVDLMTVGSPFNDLWGPNPLSTGVFDHWENDQTGDDTTYTIALGGATFCVPEPGSIALLGLGALALIRRRR